MNSVDINITLPEVNFNLEIAGQRGKQGLSAYEISVKNGFIGTEQEWLDSLKVSCETYNSIYEFPNIGDTGVFYVDKSANKTYRWDADNLKYFCVGSDYEQVNCINGGNANG